METATGQPRESALNDNEKDGPKLRPMLSMKQVLKIVPEPFNIGPHG